MRKPTIALALATSLLCLSVAGYAQEGPMGPDDGAPYAHRPDGPNGPNGPAGPAAKFPVPHHDWHRGAPVPPQYLAPQYVVDDWRAYELQPPPVGYEWLNVNGEFVLAAVTTGVIANILLAPHP
ncbi:RcnB family protein [Paraburkholderia sp. J67]|uniref:RcnB family protein n=1 Tax=Paraburkholderia sp. J67 TaxID=2805435 RepID=UPI002ABD25ED|nr:RcnB family protein [Paraburkholderia sp. J67]